MSRAGKPALMRVTHAFHKFNAPYLLGKEGVQGVPHGNEVVVTLDVIVGGDGDLFPGCQLDRLIRVFKETRPDFRALCGAMQCEGPQRKVTRP